MTAPPGLLFRGAQEGQIRREVLRENLVEGVIMLPGRVFRQSSVPISLIVFNKAKEDDLTMFIDARKTSSSKTQVPDLESLWVDDIVEIWRKRESREGISSFASIQEIESHGFSLDVGRYVEVKASPDEVDQAALWLKLHDVDEKLNKTWKDLVFALGKTQTIRSRRGAENDQG